MLTRRRKALKLIQEAQEAEAPPVKEQVKPLTLLSLPDVPLLVVLSYLQPKTLIAAGQAHPRLGALTRAHSSVWKGKTATDKYYRETVNEVCDLLRVVPPVLKLKYEVKRCPVLVARFEKFERLSASPTVTTLVLEGPDMFAFGRIIQEVKSTLEFLEVSGVERDLERLFWNLRHTVLLRSLEVRFESYFAKCAVMWPMERLILPRLRNVTFTSAGEYFDGVRQRGPDPSMLDTLRSLLRAHRGRLSYVRLGSSQMLPLLDACGPALPTLSLSLNAVGEQGLGHLLGLKDLRIHVGSSFQLATFLKSCKGPLKRLDLRNVPDRMARTLGAVGFNHLQYLSLTGDYSPWNATTLRMAVKGMPNLHSLNVLNVRKPRAYQMLDGLPAASIPKLSILVFTDMRDMPPSSDESDSDADVVTPPGYAGNAACRSLVLRAPMPLHVAVSFHYSSKGIVYFEHNESEVATCALCTEMTAAVTARCGKDAKIDQRVRVLWQ